MMMLGSTQWQQVAAATIPVSISDLKELNVEELMNIEVTSVARRPERLLAAGAAIQVITRDEIRRSGAVTLPEALSTVPGMAGSPALQRESSLRKRRGGWLAEGK